jgi:AhpD family alkylhydroperoxidase
MKVLNRRKSRIPIPDDVRTSDGTLDPYAAYQPEISEGRHRLVAAAAGSGRLDPVTTEMVRLRNAHLQGCVVCSNLRYASARRAGLDESGVSKVWDYESSDLPERQKMALRLADAFIVDMGAVRPELAVAAREQLSEAEIVEVGLAMFRFSLNKVRVAMHTDAEEFSIKHVD